MNTKNEWFADDFKSGADNLTAFAEFIKGAASIKVVATSEATELADVTPKHIKDCECLPFNHQSASSDMPECNCDGPYTCKTHDGEYRWCNNFKCKCHERLSDEPKARNDAAILRSLMPEIEKMKKGYKGEQYRYGLEALDDVLNLLKGKL